MITLEFKEKKFSSDFCHQKSDVFPPVPVPLTFFLFTQMSCQELMGIIIIKENKFAL